ncbi:TetR family transcriptional regulator [Saxibacter everestensis]|uniref:TetR family transcriptional regulator n=1 Tax=Saxibacter everestensis TaxID=2909229 RepID=A0ABY8QQY4_9MICO|nr:TetR family transcriptional regulator [Brevibacteriaceae bacterium ZFBP1038]
MVNNRGRGRPAEPTGARERLLHAARERFKAHGYTATTARAIARDAGVDHSLVNYYFTSKEGLFRAVLELVISPAEVLATAMNRTDRDRLVPSILDAAVDTWDVPEQQLVLAQLFTGSLADPATHRIMTEYIQSQLVARFAAIIGGPDASRWASGVAATITGLFYTRYVLRLEPIASMSRAEIVRYLTPPLEASLRAGRRPHRD